MTDGQGAIGPRDTEGWEKRVESLVDSLRGLYGQLDGLSRRQGELLAGDKLDALLALLRERQGVIDKISVAANELGPYVRDWDSLSGRLDGQTRARIRGGIDEIEATAKVVGQRDEEHRRTLESQRNHVADQLAGVGRGRAAVSAYGGGKRVASPRFQDRQG